MNLELCTNLVDGAIIASKYNLKRIELCAALSVGGLTPSYGLIEQCAQNSSVEIHVMIRPREGGFQYSKEEVSLMERDILASRRAGASGVVFGVLDKNNEISDLNKQLVELAKSLNLEITFHRAFDFVVNFEKAIQRIIDIGFNRVLTSGLQETAIEGLKVVKKMQQHYGNEIEIMAGSGNNENNALKIKETGIENIHFTARKSKFISEKLAMGSEMIVDEQKIKNIVALF